MSKRSHRSHGPRYGFSPPHVVSARLCIPGWEGRLRVAHLTDLHFGTMTPLALQRTAVAMANAANPDLTVLTGDYVARGLGHLEALTETLSALRGPKYAVLGNHDHWSGADRVREALRKADIEILDNTWTQFGHGQDGIALVGLDDYGTHHHEPMSATARLRGRPAIALCHNPEAAPLLWGRGASLVLSGHTHGGQFHLLDLTRRFYNAMLGVRYLDGWYRELDHQVYVNPGVGSSVVPFRYGRPAMREVAVLDLEGGPVEAPALTCLSEEPAVEAHFGLVAAAA